MKSKAAAAAAAPPLLDNFRSSMEIGPDLHFITPELYV
jgi:hypothetical protein